MMRCKCEEILRRLTMWGFQLTVQYSWNRELEHLFKSDVKTLESIQLIVQALQLYVVPSHMKANAMDPRFMQRACISSALEVQTKLP